MKQQLPTRKTLRHLVSTLALAAMVLFAPTATKAQGLLTVYGSATGTNEYVPFYGYWADAVQQNQMIYPATELTDMVDSVITQMDFYIDHVSGSQSIGNWIVSLGETTATSLSGIDNTTTLTQVYSGAMNFNSGETLMTVTFDNGYVYHGGNLLVEFNHPVIGGYKHYFFTGETVSGASYCYNSQRDFLPKVTFTYEMAPSCVNPSALHVSTSGTNATLTWISDVHSYDIAHSTSATADPSLNIVGQATTESYTMNGLTEGDHYFWVRANCSSTESSNWSSAHTYLGYCQPAPSSVDNSGITNVTFGIGSNVVNNSSTHPSSQPYYGDYTAQVGAVQAGVESTIAITYSTGYTYNTYVWVDLNNNWAFEPSEVVAYGEAASSRPTTLTLTFTIPATQAPGNYRLRIGGADSGLGSDPSSANPCYSGSYGIFEDYTLQVQAPPSCLIPTNLAVDYTGGTSATVTWEGTATTYNIDVNGTVTNNVTSPYTLPGLTLATTYQVKVQADCGTDGTSEWSNPVSFTTDLCMPANMCEITYSLTDQYDDSWNGASIDVVDALTGAVIASITMPNVEGPYEGSFSVCDGRELEFQWISGNYPNECGCVFTDANDVVIFTISQGSAPSAGTFETYTVDCGFGTCPNPNQLTATNPGPHSIDLDWNERGTATQWQICLNGDESNLTLVNTHPYTLTGLTSETTYSVKVRAYCDNTDQSNWSNTVTFTTDIACPAPTNLQAEAFSRSADLSWNGNAASYEIMGTDAHTLYYDDGTKEASMNGNMYWGVMFPAGTYTDNVLESISVYDVENTTATVYIYNDGTTAPSALVGSMNITMTNADAFVDYSFTQPLTIDPTKNLWVILYSTGTSPAAASNTVTDNNGTWLSADGGNTWSQFGVYTWMIRANAVSNIAPVTTTGNSYTLTGLTPSTDYTIHVRANCGDEGYSNWSTTVTFTTDVACPAPTNVNVTPYPTTADVAWNGFASSYEIQWAAAYTPSANALWLQYDNGTIATNIGNSSADTWTWGVMYPATMFGGNTYLNEVGIYENATYYPDNYTVNIYIGGDNAPGTLVATQTVTPSGATGLHQVPLLAPVTLDPTQNLWITLTVSGTYVMVACETTEPNNQWVYSNGTWDNIGNLASSLSGYGWMIRGLIDNIPVSYTWNTATDDASPYTITGLNAESRYLVKVRANCGDVDGMSAWTPEVLFSTAGYCDVPVNLTADVTASSATLGWTGYQDNYNVQYRTAAQIANTYFSDDFEDGLDQWTITAGSEATYPSSGIWYTYNTSGLNFDAHSGSYAASSWSWTNNTAYNSDNWLITPQVTFGSTLRFWVRTNSGWPDSYEVLLSTGSNATTDFTVTLQALAAAPATSEWNEVTIDLSTYAGQQGYIAIHHLDYDANYLLIDDFSIYDIVEEGDWISTTAADATLTLNGLTPSTAYDWRVQGISSECSGGVTEWSEIATFTTLSGKVIEANKWYAISSPRYDDDVTYAETMTNVINLLPTAASAFAYDLFRYDEATATWQNQQNTVHTDFDVFEQARGYIYRRDNTAAITFNGTDNTGNISIDLTADASGDLQGFNLVGNPYYHTYTLNERCYSLTTDGSWEVHPTSYDLSIAEAVMVNTTTARTLTFTENTSSKGDYSAAPALAFTVKGNGLQDVAYASLTEGDGMPKLSHFNESAPVLSIPVNGRRYAIADLGTDCQTFDMTFRGIEGEYTLTFNANLSTLTYCHLIDRATGKDIDLLSNNSYTFTHSNTSTISDRFQVKLTPNVDENTTGNFAYWNGNAWVVEGTGTLEVYDVVGRRVFTGNVDSQLSILNSQFPATGVYVLRMGDKNQKIVVK